MTKKMIKNRLEHFKIIESVETFDEIKDDLMMIQNIDDYQTIDYLEKIDYLIDMGLTGENKTFLFNGNVYITMETWKLISKLEPSWRL